MYLRGSAFNLESWRKCLSFPHLFGQHLSVLDVQLMQRLYVVRCEGDGNQQDVLLPSLAQAFDHLVGLGAEPRHGAHLQPQTNR